MADIGSLLRETRIRNKIDITTVEDATKIRAKYLRALENEEWSLLPGPTYVKTFLRTYAQYLGLDPHLLVEEYSARFEEPEELEVAAFAPKRRLPERARPRRRRPPRRGYGVALLLLAFVGFLLVLGLTGGEDDQAPEPARTTATEPERERARARREAAAEVGYLNPAFFVYYDECDFCKRLADAGWRTLYVPTAEAVHHDQLSTDLSAGLPRIVEFHRNRDLYMRKHHGRTAAWMVRRLTAWSYALRALAALAVPSRPARVYWVHARQALLPRRGESLRDRAERSGY